MSKIKKMAEKMIPGDLVQAGIYSNPIKNIGRVIQIEVAKKIAGKPKKMNMGGVVSGRGGSFKGTR
tara:strand:- start:30 stop:227 length:198 start_codon:yes stop_codon:yes gene_type:complete